MNSHQKKPLASLANYLRFLIYPPKCAACRTTGYENLCPRCKEELEDAFEPKKFLASGGNGYADAMFTLFPYKEYVVKQMLNDWKQRDLREFPVIFTPYLQRFLRKKLLPPKIHRITYLPRRAPARRKIGFDQAERISRLVSEELNLPTEPLLLRQGNAKTQHNERFENRERNICGAFRPARELEGETVLLIDDIVTTGATAREGARILKQAGAMKVYILSLAH